jgi:prophage antirepressor-like protein
MIRTHYDSNYEYYLAHFQNVPINILKDRRTGEILFYAASVAACLGYQSTADMMSQDEVLDIINTHIKETGESPLKRI